MEDFSPLLSINQYNKKVGMVEWRDACQAWVGLVEVTLSGSISIFQMSFGFGTISG